MIWLEKYRPKTFDEVVGQDAIVEKIRAFVKNKNLPHLLFAGPAGTGKTTVSKVISHELYGKNFSDNVLELNASDERGIDVVREKIKHFARTVPGMGFKIVFLDESDALTNAAQQALRRIMEEYSNITRFILSCNYISKIIDPIQSRCAVFRFQLHNKEDVFKLINRIEKEEKLKISDKVKDALFSISDGDARKVVNILQSCSSVSNTITEDLIYSMSGSIEPKELKEIIELAINNKFIESRNMLEDLIAKYGLSGLDLVKQINKIFNELYSKKEYQKIIEKAFEYLGEIEFRLVEGCSTKIQLFSLLAFLSNQ